MVGETQPLNLGAALLRTLRFYTQFFYVKIFLNKQLTKIFILKIGKFHHLERMLYFKETDRPAMAEMVGPMWTLTEQTWWWVTG